MATKTWVEDNELAPFVSVTLLRQPDAAPDSSKLAQALSKMLLKDDHRSDQSKVTVDGSTAWFHYVEKRPPAWLRKDANTKLADTLHHIVIVVSHGEFAAVHLSESRASEQLLRAVRRPQADTPKAVAALKLPAPTTLERAFAVGQAKTLWLHSVQRRAAVRADGKVLSGADLAHALDPFGDQGYAFTSARCTSGQGTGKERAVGISPSRARTWRSRSSSRADFTSQVEGLLKDAAKAANKKKAPPATGFRRLLAQRATTAAPKLAFDVSVSHPALDDEPSGASIKNERIREQAVRWAEETTVTVVKAGQSPDLRVKVDGPGQPGCQLDMKLEDGTFTVTCTSGPDHEDCAEARTVLATPEWVTVRYESAHAVFDEGVFKMRLSDREFSRFEWPKINTSIYDVSEEKPRDLAAKQKGKTQGLANVLSVDRLKKLQPSETKQNTAKSLFVWIAEQWPAEVLGCNAGWMICDDRNDETADFIHLDPQNKVLSLVHVKAGKKTGSLRMKEFEEVTAQALKNLRWLDTHTLPKEVKSPTRKRLWELVWEAGTLRTGSNEKFSELLEDQNMNFARRVVIVQPALTRNGWKKARPAKRRLLNTLLIGAAGVCAQHGAELIVCGRAS